MVIKMSILMILISSMVMNMVEVEVDQIESWVKDFQVSFSFSHIHTSFM